ncbi:MAG TPA: hypothetical protein PLQ35_14465 [bacterium]|nr:hypothetical protein [bacterium]
MEQTLLKSLVLQKLERNNDWNTGGTQAEDPCSIDPQKNEGGGTPVFDRSGTPKPNHSDPVSGPIAEPSPSGAVPTVPSDPVRESIARLVEYAARIGAGPVGEFLERHPQQWAAVAFEYDGMVAQLSETKPDADRGFVSDLAAESVCLWVRLDFLREIEGDTYRAKMHGPGGVWDRLRKGAR